MTSRLGQLLLIPQQRSYALTRLYTRSIRSTSSIPASASTSTATTTTTASTSTESPSTSTSTSASTRYLNNTNRLVTRGKSSSSFTSTSTSTSTSSSSSSSTSLTELSDTSQWEGDTEDVLMAHTDPFGLISTKYNPAVVRAFKESKLIKTENQAFRGAVKVTEKALLALNKKLSRASLETMQVSYLPSSVETARNKVQHDFLKVVRSLRTDAELKGITSFMTILLPRSTHLWEEFDKHISKIFHSHPLQFAELGLLVSYSFHKAKQAYTFWSRDSQKPHSQNNATHLKTPTMMFQYLIDLKRKQQSLLLNHTNLQKPCFATNIPITLDQNVFEIFAGDCASIFSSEASEVFAPLGGMQARDNKAMEVLGLQLSLFANYGHLLTTEHGAMKQVILEDLSNHLLKVLSSAHTPVKLSTLRELWENAPKIDLPNSYSIYKQLYQQVIYSVTTEPLQIIHQDDGICTLFESMIASKFKSSMCIAKLFEVVSSRGMDYQKVGVRLFNALVQLDSIPFATMILDNMMKNSGMKLEYLFTQSTKGRPFLLSDEAKEQVLRTLHESSVQNYIDGAAIGGDFEIMKKKSSNLGLALFCFNREDKKTQYYKLLEQMEVSLLTHLQVSEAASVNETIGLVHSYALAGRLQPQVFVAASRIFQNNFDKLTTKQLSTIIWSCARLNHQPDYLLRVTRAYFQEMSNIKHLSTPGAYALSRTLWALAVMQLLDIDRFLSVQSLLFKSSKLLQGVEIHSWMIKQLTQIEVELLLKHQGEDIEEKLKPLRQFLENSTSYQNLNKRILRENLSSWTHMDASRALAEIGIDHENEKLLQNGYVVDIFIPPQGQISRGIVIEFDGPSHFESYLNLPLGPTLMKKRHVEALGFKVVTIPFWRYKHDQTKDQKIKILSEALYK